MKIIKNKAVSQEVIDGELFLYNQETRKIVCLNKTATNIWNIIEDEEKADLLKHFLDMYHFKDEDEKKLAEDDFNNVVADLEGAGCIMSQS